LNSQCHICFELDTQDDMTD